MCVLCPPVSLVTLRREAGLAEPASRALADEPPLTATHRRANPGATRARAKAVLLMNHGVRLFACFPCSQGAGGSGCSLLRQPQWQTETVGLHRRCRRRKLLGGRLAKAARNYARYGLSPADLACIRGLPGLSVSAKVVMDFSQLADAAFSVPPTQTQRRGPAKNWRSLYEEVVKSWDCPDAAQALL